MSNSSNGPPLRRPQPDGAPAPSGWRPPKEWGLDPWGVREGSKLRMMQELMAGVRVTITWKGLTISVAASTGLVIALIVLWRLMS